MSRAWIRLRDIKVTGTAPAGTVEVSVSATDDVASENNSNTAVWTITRVGDTTQSLSIPYTLSGSATHGNDYTLDRASPITFAPGEDSVVVTMTAVDDKVFNEGAEKAKLTIPWSGPGFQAVTASGTVSILDNDPLVTLSVSDHLAKEAGQDTAKWTLARTGDNSEPLSVPYTLSGSATEGSDYTVNKASPITFPAGQSEVVVTLTPVDDAVAAEGDELAIMTLTEGSGHILGKSTGSITIHDDEGFDVSVLVLGTDNGLTSTFSDSSEPSKVFKGSAVKNQLEKILAQAGVGTTYVRYLDYGTIRNDINDQTYTETANLLSWFYSPYPTGVVKEVRWPDLRGEYGMDWDYVVIIGDPYTIEYQPGVYAIGAGKVAEQVTMGGAEAILLMPWPGNGSDSSVDHYREVTYRVGRSGGYKVAPAAMAWEAAGSPAGTAHPTTHGAYIAAASVFSAMFDQSAEVSGYTYNDGSADTAYTTLKENESIPQYSGRFTPPYVTQRLFDNQDRFVQIGREFNSSTENGYAGAAGQAIRRAGATPTGGWPVPVDGAKRYEVGRSSNNFMIYEVRGGDYHHAAASISESYFDFSWLNYTALRDNNYRQRVVPYHMILANTWQDSEGVDPSRDGVHPSSEVNIGCASYMYHMVSGRCPVVPKPDNPGAVWWAQLAGYEIAWQLTQCQARAPGFKVMPKSHTIGFTYPEKVDIRFFFPPKSDVTVNIASSIPGVSVTPATLTFTPENYDQPQIVQLQAIEGMTSPGTSCSITFDTSSDDEVYDQLNDTWPYTGSFCSATAIDSNQSEGHRQ